MGETVLPAVEETSPQAEEPPIGGFNAPRTTPPKRQPQPTPGDGDPPPALNAPHTLSFEEVAEQLHVDIRFDFPLSHLHSAISLTRLVAMDSAMLKQNLAFGSMDLTRLRELKGFPCGKFC